MNQMAWMSEIQKSEIRTKFHSVSIPNVRIYKPNVQISDIYCKFKIIKNVLQQLNDAAGAG